MAGLEGILKITEPWNWLEGALKTIEPHGNGTVGLEGTLRIMEPWNSWVERSSKITDP